MSKHALGIGGGSVRAPSKGIIGVPPRFGLLENGKCWDKGREGKRDGN